MLSSRSTWTDPDRGEVALVGEIRSLADVDRSDQFGDQEVEVGIALAVRMGAHVDRHVVDRNGEIGAVVEIEAAQEILVGLAVAAVLGDDQAGHDFERFGGPGKWPRIDLFTADIFLARGRHRRREPKRPAALAAGAASTAGLGIAMRARPSASVSAVLGASGRASGRCRGASTSTGGSAVGGARCRAGCQAGDRTAPGHASMNAVHPRARIRKHRTSPHAADDMTNESRAVDRGGLCCTPTTRPKLYMTASMMMSIIHHTRLLPAGGRHAAHHDYARRRPDGRTRRA